MTKENQEKVDSNNEIISLKTCQDITFKALSELIINEAKKGNSLLFVTNFNMGGKMIEYLKQKGFIYTVTPSYKSISW